METHKTACDTINGRKEITVSSSREFYEYLAVEISIIKVSAFYLVCAATFLQISLVYSLHFAVPPRSPVRYFASLIVS